jgi:hypothetical protein
VSSAKRESILPVPVFFDFFVFLPSSIGDSATGDILADNDLRRKVSESAVSVLGPARSPTDWDPLGPGVSAIDGSDDPGEVGDVPDSALDLDLSDGTAGTLGAGLSKPEPLLTAPARPATLVPESEASWVRPLELESVGDLARKNCLVLFRMFNPAERPRRLESEGVGELTVGASPGLILVSPAFVFACRGVLVNAG